MSTWEQVLTGVVVLLVLLWMRPGMKAIMKKSREAEERDWMGALIPIGLVALFVILLMYNI